MLDEKRTNESPPIHTEAWELLRNLCNTAVTLRQLRAERSQLEARILATLAELSRVTDRCQALQVRITGLPVIDVRERSKEQLWPDTTGKYRTLPESGPSENSP